VGGAGFEPGTAASSVWCRPVALTNWATTYRIHLVAWIRIRIPNADPEPGGTKRAKMKKIYGFKINFLLTYRWVNYYGYRWYTFQLGYFQYRVSDQISGKLNPVFGWISGIKTAGLSRRISGAPLVNTSLYSFSLMIKFAELNEHILHYTFQYCSITEALSCIFSRVH
jgi:hypothetical protein